MRINRGRAKGFRRAGRIFVELSEQPNGPVRPTADADEQTRPTQATPRATPSDREHAAEPLRDRSESAGAAGGIAGAGPEEVPEQALPVVVEFQKIELSRLLRDNARLNQRLDQIMDEFRHLREMQQREQVLRQQDQALRQQIQGTLDRLTERLPPPAHRGSRSPASVAAPESAAPGPESAPPAVPERAAQAAPRPASSDAYGASEPPAPAPRPALAPGESAPAGEARTP